MILTRVAMLALLWKMAAHLTEIWKVISGGAPHACEKPKFLSPLTSTANVFDSPTDDGKG
jgi:hypothetical protein